MPASSHTSSGSPAASSRMASTLSWGSTDTSSSARNASSTRSCSSQGRKGRRRTGQDEQGLQCTTSHLLHAQRTHPPARAARALGRWGGCRRGGPGGSGGGRRAPGWTTPSPASAAGAASDPGAAAAGRPPPTTTRTRTRTRTPPSVAVGWLVGSEWSRWVGLAGLSRSIGMLHTSCDLSSSSEKGQ